MLIADFEVAKRAIAQIYYADSDEIVGTGFWVGGRYLITCAHVVRAALRPSDCPSYDDIKGHSIRLVFAEAKQVQKLSAEVIYCKYEPRDGGKDAAVLMLEKSLCFDCHPIHMPAYFSGINGVDVKAFGYIDGHPMGLNLETKTRGTVGGGGWIQVDSSKTRGIAVSEGLSGAPVWCDRYGLAGMVVARDKNKEDRVGFIIPVDELSEPRRLIHSQLLLDILKPHEASLNDRIMSSYRVCRGRHAAERSHTNLEDMLTELANRGKGSEGLPNKLIQLIACLLNNLEPLAFQGLIADLNALVECLADEANTIDLNAVRVSMRDVALAHNSQRVEPVNPKLWVSVHAADITGAPPFSIEAWLIPDPEGYDAKTGEGAVKLSSQVLPKHLSVMRLPDDISISEEAIDYEHLPLMMATYLDQVVRGQGIEPEDLTLELFLPFSLLNEPVERMLVSDGLFIVPLGIGEEECPQVLLRSRDRLEKRSHKKWHKKWMQAEASLQSTAATQLAANRTTLKQDLKEPHIIGFKLSGSPALTIGGELHQLTAAGAPLAIWIRDCPNADTLAQQLEDDFLHHPLQSVLEKVLALRRETECEAETICSNSVELGHHLVILWENPKHVPPNYNDPFSNMQLA